MRESIRMNRHLATLLFAVWFAIVAPTVARAAPGATSATAAQHDTAVSDSTRADSALSDSAALSRDLSALATQSESATPETVSTAREVTVPVFLGGKEIFRVRTGRDGLDPTQRASAIRARLNTAVADLRVPADSVRIFSTPDGVEVRLGRYFLWLITPGDVEGVSPSDLPARMTELPERIREGVEKERAGRRPLGILIAFLLAIGLTLVAWLAVRLLLSGARRWRAWLRLFLPKHVGGIRLREFEVLSQPQVTGIISGVLGRLDVVVGVVLLYVYLTLLFSFFPWTQGWSWLLVHFAVVEITEVALSIARALPGLFTISIIVMVARWLTSLFDRFFDSVATDSHHVPGFHPELARPSKRLVRILLWVAAVIIAFPFIPGAQSKAFQGVSLFLGVLVSLGSTGVVGNVIAGLVLTYSRSFRVGDRVKIGDHSGDVVNLGFFATKLRTIRNEEMTIPNGQVASSAITNYTRLSQDPGLILHTQITIGYDVEWRQVHELMIGAALRVEGIEKEPKPWVFQRSLDDYYVAYEINCVTHQSHPQLRLYSDLHAEIQDAFSRAGVEILSPAYHAIRDANAAVLPVEPKGPRGEPGSFRVRNT